MIGKTELFAGLNSVGGYVPLLEYILSPMKRVFIIKGSAGSGKSTMMKRVAAAARAKGEDVVEIHCSSDPDSLDGVMIPRLGVAVADGTAPHTLDPQKYGIREITVSLEDSFDYEKLDFFAGRLSRLLDKKAVCMRSASTCISACGEVDGLLAEYLEPTVRKDKIYDFCRGFLRRHTKRGEGTVIMMPTDTFCRKGFVTTGTFEDAEKKFVIHDKYGESAFLLKNLYANAVASGVNMRVIPCPIDNRAICGIYFPDTDVLIKSDHFVNTEGRKINMSRFTDGETMTEHRGSINTLVKIREKLYAEAAATMEKAFEMHVETEKIYSQCVDFDVTDRITKELIKRILPD